MRAGLNNTETLGSLMVRVQDTIEREQRNSMSVGRIELIEMADGSGRPAAMIHGMVLNQDGSAREKFVRVAAPAPATAPTWAQREHGEWEIEEVQYA